MEIQMLEIRKETENDYKEVYNVVKQHLKQQNIVMEMNKTQLMN